jgi:hypothetical protein
MSEPAMSEPAMSEPASGSKMTVEKVHEKHVTEEHATKMRIWRKKEELIDLLVTILSTEDCTCRREIM